MLDLVAHHILPAALALLPDRMTSRRAAALLLAIGLQESRFRYRSQMLGGPARSLWQFEPVGVRGVLVHPATQAYAHAVCERLLYPPTVDAVYDAIGDNDVLAACFARLLLWQHPNALPGSDNPTVAWSYYIDQWRPGKPHRGTFDAHFKVAWEIGDK